MGLLWAWTVGMTMATVQGWTALPADRKAPAAGEELQPPGTPNVHCTSTKGDFVIEMHPEWAPIGAERFLAIVGDGGLDGTVIYRTVHNEAVQFGFIKDEAIRRKYNTLPNLKDDPQIFKNPNFHRGMISFAGAGPNTRGSDVFITFMTGNANGTPRAPWETPFGIIAESGLKAVTSFYDGYGDFKSFGGNAPELGRGYESFKKSHPKIDYLGKCTLVYPSTVAPPPPPPHHMEGAVMGGAPRRAVHPHGNGAASGAEAEHTVSLRSVAAIAVILQAIVILVVARRALGYGRPLAHYLRKII